VTEIDDVAGILRGATVLLALHDGVPWRFLGSRGVATVPAGKIGVRFDVLYGGRFCSSGNAA
jgi:hypothetical protein